MFGRYIQVPAIIYCLKSDHRSSSSLLYSIVRQPSSPVGSITPAPRTTSLPAATAESTLGRILLHRPHRPRAYWKQWRLLHPDVHRPPSPSLLTSIVLSPSSLLALLWSLLSSVTTGQCAAPGSTLPWLIFSNYPGLVWVQNLPLLPVRLGVGEGGKEEAVPVQSAVGASPMVVLVAGMRKTPGDQGPVLLVAGITLALPVSTDTRRLSWPQCRSLPASRRRRASLPGKVLKGCTESILTHSRKHCKLLFKSFLP